MELDITDLLARGFEPNKYCASVAMLGNDAGRITWNAAKDDAPAAGLLDTEEKRAAFRDHAREYGAWSDQEIDAWTDTEMTALLLQIIGAEFWESGLNPDAPDWHEYERQAEAGIVSGSLYGGHMATDGRVYFSF